MSPLRRRDLLKAWADRTGAGVDRIQSIDIST
jgi:hypothetical protein